MNNAVVSYAVEHRQEALAYLTRRGTPIDDAEDVVQNALLGLTRFGADEVLNVPAYWWATLRRAQIATRRRELALKRPRTTPLLFEDEIGYPVGGDAERDALTRMELHDTLDLIEEVASPAERAAMARQFGSDGPHLTTTERVSLHRLRKKLRAAAEED